MYQEVQKHVGVGYFSIHHVSPRDQTQIVRLACKHLCPLSHLLISKENKTIWEMLENHTPKIWFVWNILRFFFFLVFVCVCVCVADEWVFSISSLSPIPVNANSVSVVQRTEQTRGSPAKYMQTSVYDLWNFPFSEYQSCILLACFFFYNIEDWNMKTVGHY